MTFQSALSPDKASHTFLTVACVLSVSFLTVYFNKYSGTLSESHLIHKQGSCYIIFRHCIFSREHWLSQEHLLSILSVMS